MSDPMPPSEPEEPPQPEQPQAMESAMQPEDTDTPEA